MFVGVAVECKRPCQGVAQGARGVIQAIGSNHRDLIQVKWQKGSLVDNNDADQASPDCIGLRLGLLKLAGKSEPEAAPTRPPVVLPDGVSYCIRENEALYDLESHVRRVLYQVYLSRSPTVEDLLVTKTEHALVAKKDFKTNSLVLPPFVEQFVLATKKKKGKKDGELDVEVSFGTSTKRFTFRAPADQKTGKETGETLVCAPFWLAWNGLADHPNARQLVMRRGIITLPLHSFLSKDICLKSRVGTRGNPNDQLVTVNLPYLVNAVDVHRGDMLFADAI